MHRAHCAACSAFRNPLGRGSVFPMTVQGTGPEHQRAQDHQQGHSDRHHWMRTGQWDVLPVHHPNAIVRAAKKSKQTHIHQELQRQQWLCVCSSVGCRRESCEQFYFCRQGYSQYSCLFTPNGYDEYFTSHTGLSHLPLLVFPRGAAHGSRQLQKWAAGCVLSSTAGLMAASEANRLHSYSYFHTLVSSVREN